MLCRVAFKLRYWEVRGWDHAAVSKDGESPYLRERSLDDGGERAPLQIARLCRVGWSCLLPFQAVFSPESVCELPLDTVLVARPAFCRELTCGLLCAAVQLLGFIYCTTKVMDLALQIARMVLSDAQLQRGRRIQLFDKPSSTLK